jgi:hypothetical protein
MTFKLHEHAITYMSFYRYARRVRDRGNVAELATLDAETETDLTPAINKLAARQLLEILLNEDQFDHRALATLTAALDRLSRFESRQRARADTNALTTRRLDQNDLDLQLKSQQIELIRERLQYLRDSRTPSDVAAQESPPPPSLPIRDEPSENGVFKIAASDRAVNRPALSSEFT